MASAESAAVLLSAIWKSLVKRKSSSNAFAAWRLHWQWQDAVDLAEPARQSLHQQAVEAHHRALAFARQLDVTAAQRVLDGHEFELKDQSGAKRVATEKQVKAARESLEKAQKTLAEQLKPTDNRAGHRGREMDSHTFLEFRCRRSSSCFGPQEHWSPYRAGELDHRSTQSAHARVAVNHIWTRHFGQSLVDPAFDFGRKTPEPRHRLLLDWLAAEFMESDGASSICIA